MEKQYRTRLYVIVGLLLFALAFIFVLRKYDESQDFKRTNSSLEILKKDRPAERVKPIQSTSPESNKKYVVKTRVEMFVPENTENQ